MRSSRSRFAKPTRGWSDVLAAVGAIQSQKPDRRPDNIAVTRRMTSLLGLEPATRACPFVHVAGTKGKGTTCAFVSHLCQGAGQKVGLFTSPHLIDVRERILINNAMLPKETFARYFFEVLDRQDEIEYGAPSQFDRSISKSAFFRFTFFLALHIFASEKVDIAVVETGIGGRLDSTNTLTPIACGITALGYDHQDLLGDTIEEIASEKAGIIKPAIPCFTDPQREYPQALEVLRARAEKIHAPLVVADDRAFPMMRRLPPLAMTGSFMQDNARLALALFRFSARVPLTAPLQTFERDALQTTRVAGRCQVVPLGPASDAFLDGAHTPESVAKAAVWFTEETLRRGVDSRPTVLVLYTTRDSAALFKGLAPLLPKAEAVLFVHVENTRLPGSGGEAARVLREMGDAWRGLYGDRVPCMECRGGIESLDHFRSLVGATGDASGGVNVFATGSLYLVGSVLGVVEQAGDAPPAPRPKL